MRNPTRCIIYIITEGKCISYKGVPMLFTHSQAEKFLHFLCTEVEIIKPISVFRNNSIFKPM